MKHKKTSYVFTLRGSPNRDGEEHKNTTDLADETAWDTACKTLGTRSYTANDMTAVVHGDLRPMHRRVKKFNRITRQLLAREIEYTEHLYPNSSVRLPVDVKLKHKKKELHGWEAGVFADQYVHELFMMMNLAVPGSCDFYGLSRKDRFGRSGVRLSAYNFEQVFYESAEGALPAIRILPLETVVTWYSSLEISSTQIARTPLQRVLFDILHIARNELTPVTVVWVFHALEALYDMEVGEGYRKLVSRVNLLLDVPVSKQKPVARRIRKLFDLRSKVVHGGFAVWHPLEARVYGDDVDSKYQEVLRLTDFGFALIVASLQELILKGYAAVEFNDVLVGHQLQNE